MKKSDTTKNITTFATPEFQSKVTAKKNIANMKTGQVGFFTFQQMRFSEKIMVMGEFGDWAQINPNKPDFELQNKVGFYKPLTLVECLEYFEFPLLSEFDFEKQFKDFKPQQVK
ncbi:hypothetical protein [Runella limosa]|uniref:hypothetical protein n=1 Tax=Runella limosa TaxID=370978 RepID=UPI0003FEECB7|nr:hypothetical protein [Runella limosa]